MNKIGKTATSIKTEQELTKIIYHDTCIVKFNHEKIILNSGGWRTATTKRRMNQISNVYKLGYRVYQHDFTWYIKFHDSILKFYDNMELVR